MQILQSNFEQRKFISCCSVVQIIKKIHSAKRFNTKMGLQNDEQNSYELRKKPRKSWRFSDSDHETLIQEYQCSICRKGFRKIQSLNAHVKHHYSDQEIGHMEVKKKKGLDDVDDDEKCLMFNMAKKPRTKRYKIVDGSSVVSHYNSCSFDDNSADVNGDQIDHDAEEAAMVLMMLSSGVLVSGEFNDLVMEPALWNQEVINDDDDDDGDGDALVKDSAVKHNEKDDDDDGDALVKDSAVKHNKKAKIAVSDPELGESCDTFDGSCKKSDKHKCRTCDRTFSSYQALGGHRARQHSTVKKNDVSNSKIETCKRGIETSNSNNVETNDENLEPTRNAVRKQANERSYEAEKGNACACLICFKVFGSGKALGGHMRAHYHPEQQRLSDNDYKKLDGFDGNGDGGVRNSMLYGGDNKQFAACWPSF